MRSLCALLWNLDILSRALGNYWRDLAKGEHLIYVSEMWLMHRGGGDDTKVSKPDGVPICPRK